MSLDALALHAIRDDLNRDVLGGHVDSVWLMNPHAVCLEIFAGKKWFVVLAPDPAEPRVYVTAERPRRDTERVTPLLLLLRKHVRGARLVEVEQPRLERLLVCRFSTRIDGEPPRRVEMVLELMGRRSNLVLVDEDGAILDALTRLPPSINPSRPLLPHLRYTPPKGENKHDPRDPALGTILSAQAQATEVDAWRHVVALVSGFSPIASREVLARCACDPEGPANAIPDWGVVAEAIRELTGPVDTHAWSPTIAWDGEHVLGFAPYPLRQFPDAEVRACDTMSAAMTQLVDSHHGRKPMPFDRLRQPLIDGIASRLDALRRKRSSLERSLAMADRADELRSAGEAILASLHEIREGDVALTWNGRRIDLYPNLAGVENAQAYFRQYADARDAKTSVPPLLQQTETEIAYLEDMNIYVNGARDERELSSLRRELEDAEVLRPAKPRPLPKNRAQQAPTREGIVRRESVEGVEVLIGGSAAGNDTVTFRMARPGDLWFHARGRPGAHVVLRTAGSPITERHILASARIAASHCAAGDDDRIEVDYVERRFVRRVPGRLPGRATYRNAATVMVSPERPAAPLVRDRRAAAR
ncbi:MAG TPA: NFACT family protein [Chloroflexota bacterium]|nr:NFACT family protein [Chloroflexota bacterium]